MENTAIRPSSRWTDYTPEQWTTWQRLRASWDKYCADPSEQNKRQYYEIDRVAWDKVKPKT